MKLAETALQLLGLLIVSFFLGRYLKQSKWDALVAVFSGMSMALLFRYGFGWGFFPPLVIGVLVTIGVRALLDSQRVS